jgi:hypothetical protein
LTFKGFSNTTFCMAYVYVVTRITSGAPRGVTNLGVHSNRKGAEGHFNQVLLARKNLDGVIRHLPQLLTDDSSRVEVLRSSVIEKALGQSEGEREELRLERWRVVRA